MSSNIHPKITGWLKYVMVVVTPITRALGIMTTPEVGATSSLWVAASPEFGAKESGSYVEPHKKIAVPSKNAQNAEMADRLWQVTEDHFKDLGLLPSA